MVSNIVPFEITDLKRADFSGLKYFYAEAYTLFPQIILNFCFLRTLPSEWHASKDVDRNRPSVSSLWEIGNQISQLLFV